MEDRRSVLIVASGFSRAEVVVQKMSHHLDLLVARELNQVRSMLTEKAVALIITEMEFLMEV